MSALRAFVVHPTSERALWLERVVGARGYTVERFESGEQAIDRFVQGPADLLLIDYVLPGRDGVATAEAIRWAPGGRDVPIILLADEEPVSAPLSMLALRADATAALVGALDEARLAEILIGLERAWTDEGTVAVESEGYAAHLREARRDDTPKSSERWIDASTVIAGVVRADAAAFADESTGRLDASAARAIGLGASPRLADRPIATFDDLTITEPGEGVTSLETASFHALDAKDVRALIAVPARELVGLASPTSAPVTSRDPSTRPIRVPEKASPTSVDPRALEEAAFVASYATSPNASFSGSFTETPFPALLQRVADAREHGALVCTRADAPSHGTLLVRTTVDGAPPRKIVFFRAGVPVHVRSNVLDECLGQLLVRKKVIDVDVVEESLRRMRERGDLQGKILVEMGALSAAELERLLEEQARQKLFDLFGWRDGDYRFFAGMEAPSEGGGLELALPDMVYEGVLTAMPATLLLDIMTSRLDAFVVPEPGRLERFARTQIARDLREVLARLDGTAPLREVLRWGGRPGAIAQLLYALECLGAVSYQATPRAREPGGAASTDRAAKAATRREGATRVEGVISPVARDVVPPERTSGVVPAAERDPASAASTRAESEADDARGGAGPGSEGSAPSAASSPHATELDGHVDRMFSAERFFRRGNRALERGEHGEALVAFERAVELCPDEGEFVAYLGWARYCLDPTSAESVQAALDALARACDLAPALHLTHLLRGRALEHAGRREEALEAYRRVLALSPSMAEAAAAVERLERAALG